ncbi:MAG: hypothetical protein M3441_26020 [Chloroflexota bacterium]|nr:hypothetical protein [Chloroflexota bacterium]
MAKKRWQLKRSAFSATLKSFIHPLDLAALDVPVVDPGDLYLITDDLSSH